MSESYKSWHWRRGFLRGFVKAELFVARSATPGCHDRWVLQPALILHSPTKRGVSTHPDQDQGEETP